MKNKSLNKISTTVLTFLTLILFGATLTTAAPGDLDLSFGSGGIVVTSIGDQFYYDAAQTVLVQPDGKIVVCGQISDTDNNGDRAFFLTRYHPTGTLDASFGTNGKIIGPINSGAIVGLDIALQPDGKIVAVGYDYPASGFAIHRYNANGTLDASFGTGGVVITPVGAVAIATSVAIQADGKIVLAGYSQSAGQSYWDFAVVRLQPDGSLDTSFGGTGKVITSFGNSAQAGRVFLQPDGKIVAVGSLLTGIAPNYLGRFAMARYNADGSLDSGFGTGGKVTHTVANGGMYLGDAALQPDGKIVALGRFSAPPNLNWGMIVRFNPNGSIDTNFATNGIFGTEPSLYIAGIALQPDGKLVAFGYENGGGNYRFAILRLNSNGTPDTGFGGNGRVFTPIGSYSYASDGVVQPDGKILALGGTGAFFDTDTAIVRYLGDSAVSRPAQFDFDGDRRADLSVFRPSDRTWYLNQSTNGFASTQWGFSTDRITPADFDGDSKTDISVYRDGAWYWLASSNYSYNTINFGIASDIPVPADYTGDGRAELAVYRNGTWWIQNLTDNQTQVINFGLAADKPVPADFDGDGRSDQAIYRNGEWHLNRSSQGYTVVNFGLSTDKPVIGDYDGDGKADQAVYRDGTWYLLQSTQGFTVFPFGISTDIPTPADYDGDGKTDAAVFRDGVWYLLQSTSGVSIQQFGFSTDKPVPSAFVP
jgi:uncharacterized delta-60 repeat protein